MYLLVLDELVPQELLYADGHRSLLICLQGMDARFIPTFSSLGAD
jgi:hypothetical protein